MADEEILLEIKVDTDKANQDVERLTDEMVDLNNQVKELSKTNKKLEKEGKQNGLQYKDNAKKIALLKSNMSNLNRERANSIKTIQATSNSYGALKTRLNDVARAIDKVDYSTDAGRKQLKALRKEQNQLNKALKQGEQTGGSFGRNVGNYTDALGQASPATSGFISTIKGMTTAAKAFIATPLGLVLAAIGAAFGAVVAYFKRTEEGGDKLAIAMAYVTSIFDSFMTAISNVGEFLVTYIINGFKLVVNNAKIMALSVKTAFLAIDVAIQKITGTTEEYEEAQKRLAENNKEIIKLGKEQVDIVKDTVNAGKDAIKQTVEEIALTKQKAEQSAALQKLENRLVKIRREQITGNAKLNKVIYEGLLIAKDENKSYEEREKALKKASDAEQKLVDDKLYAARIERDIAVARTAQFDSTAEDYDNEAKAIAKVTELEIESARTKTKIQATQLTLQKQKEADRNKEEKAKQKEIDDELKRLQKVADANQKLYNKREQDRIDDLAGTQEAFDAQNALYDVQYQKELDRINASIEDDDLRKTAIETATYDHERKKYLLKVEFDEKANDLADDSAQKEEARISRLNEMRKRSFEFASHLLSAGFSIAKSFAGKNEKLQRSLGLFEVAVNTAVGITKAFATLPTPAAIPASIKIGATGLAQAAAIRSAGGGGGNVSLPSDSITNTSGTNPNTTNIDNSISEREALENAIANLGLTVSVTEINDVQNQVQVTQQTATI